MRLLVVEDDPDLRRQLTTALADAGYAVDAAKDGDKKDDAKDGKKDEPKDEPEKKAEPVTESKKKVLKR